MAEMCPAEVMAKAAYDLGEEDYTWVQFKRRYPAVAQERIKEMRAALRAVAEMYQDKVVKNALLHAAAEETP